MSMIPNVRGFVSEFAGRGANPGGRIPNILAQPDGRPVAKAAAKAALGLTHGRTGPQAFRGGPA